MYNIHTCMLVSIIFDRGERRGERRKEREKQKMRVRKQTQNRNVKEMWRIKYNEIKSKNMRILVLLIFGSYNGIGKEAETKEP